MLERIKDILVEYVEVPREEITEESKLVADLGLSSLDVVSVVGEFEEEFGVEIPERLLAEISTVGDVLRVLEQSK